MPEKLTRVLHTSFHAAITKTVDALKSEGFGILTEIDVQATLKQKLGTDMRPYRILGACNPPFAHQALQLNPDAGLMMPCNVAVYESESGRVVVSAVDPSATSAALGDVRLTELAAAVREKLGRALAQLE